MYLIKYVAYYYSLVCHRVRGSLKFQSNYIIFGDFTAFSRHAVGAKTFIF